MRNPQERWVRVEGAFPGVIDPRLFRETQAAMAGWTTRISDAAALAALRDLYARHGTLTAKAINAAEGMPGSHFYEHRFGGLTKAYAQVGYKPGRDLAYLEGHAGRLRLLTGLREEVALRLRERGVVVECESRSVIVLGGRVRVAVMLGTCKVVIGAQRWLVQVAAEPHPDWVLIARLKEQGTAVQDYWLVKGGARHILLGVRPRVRRERYRADGLPPLLDRLAFGEVC